MPRTGEFSSYARVRLQGFWGTAMLACLIAILLGGLENTANFNYSESIRGGIVESFSVPWYMIWARGIPVLLLAYSIAILLIGGAVELGVCAFFCRTALGERPRITVLFDRFDIFFKALGLRLFMGLFIFLWALLLVVPGIIAAYRYAMAPYFMAEYSQMGIREAVDRSKEVMRDRKGKLFLLQLSIQIWPILIMLLGGLLGMTRIGMVAGVVLGGVAALVVSPWMQTAESAFYLHLTGRVLQPEVVTPLGGMPPQGDGAETI